MFWQSAHEFSNKLVFPVQLLLRLFSLRFTSSLTIAPPVPRIIASAARPTAMTHGRGPQQASSVMNDAVAQFRFGPHNTFVGMRAVGQLGTRCICCSTLQVPAHAVSLGFVPDSRRHRTPSVSCGVVPGNEVISLALLQLAV